MSWWIYAIYSFLYTPLKELQGYYIRSHRVKVICINSNADEHQLKYICAHELGHALLHDGLNIHYLTNHCHFTTGRYEREADIFAMELLLADSDEDSATIYDMAKSVGLPIRVAESYGNYLKNSP